MKKFHLILLLILCTCLFAGCKTVQRKDMDTLVSLQTQFASDIAARESAVIEFETTGGLVFNAGASDEKFNRRLNQLSPTSEEGKAVTALYVAYIDAQNVLFEAPSEANLAKVQASYDTYHAEFTALWDENSGIDGFGRGFVYEFNRNLIAENRWQALLEGLLVTLEVTALSITFGTLLGILFCLMRISSIKVLSKVSGAYIDIIRGTPSVIQLLIIYYGVFASVNVDKIIVASIAFAVNSSAYIAEIIRAGILSVNKGQIEAGRSLGFSYAQTMLYIVMPQAIKNALPSYANEFITLIKETAIVGYVALNDLTKISSMIQSRTFSPWFPLLSAALVYFVITKLLAVLFSAIERRLRRSDAR